MMCIGAVSEWGKVVGAMADRPAWRPRLSASVGAVLLWAGLASTAASAQTMPANHAPEVVEQIVLVCEAVYMPARSVWNREVLVEHDQHRVRAVFIDGVRVYSFSVHENLIFTALDNERIQLDLAALTWQSDFRGMAAGWGECRSREPASPSASEPQS